MEVILAAGAEGLAFKLGTGAPGILLGDFGGCCAAPPPGPWDSDRPHQVGTRGL